MIDVASHQTGFICALHWSLHGGHQPFLALRTFVIPTHRHLPRPSIGHCAAMLPTVSRAVLLFVLMATVLLAAPLVKREPTWADVETATVHPGVNTVTEGGSCTANFVFYNGAGDVFIGQSAHCAAGSGDESHIDGCKSPSLPEGTGVNVTGAAKNGTLAYSSWVRMQAAGGNKTYDEYTCFFNDFALVKLDPQDHHNVNPSIPRFGGPSGIRTTDMGLLEPLYAFGNSITRKGNKFLQPKYGVQREQFGDGWSHKVVGTVGIPGDSGCAAIDKDGKAVGVLR